MRFSKQCKQFLAIGLLTLANALPAQAITINIEYSGLSVSQQSIFEQAKGYWETALTGYQPGVNAVGPLSSVDIDASGIPIDRVGGILGRAGPTRLMSSGGYILATQGIMEFDTFDLNNMESNGTLGDVILHEIAHVLGFGTLWDNNLVYNNGSGQYTGAFGLAAYRSEFDPGAGFVPVELDFGSGTADAHWDEVFFGDGSGTDLMTGILSSNITISSTTLQSFQDIGFTVVPLPAAIWLFASALGLMGYGARRRRVAA